MASAFTTLLRCTLGTEEFQLTEYTFSNDPIILERKGALSGAIGSTLSVEGKGFIEGTDASDLSVKLWAAKRAFAVNGQNFQIIGLSDKVEVSIQAARCLDRGPHCGFKLLGTEGPAPFTRVFEFSLTAETARFSGGGTGDEDAAPPPTEEEQAEEDKEKYSETIAVRPDSLRSIIRTSEIRGANVIARFTGGILANFKLLYAPPAFVVTYEYEVNEAVDVLSFSMTAVQLRNPLPNGAEPAVDGEGSKRIDRDEQGRVVETWEYDLLIAGDYQAVLKSIRPALKQGEIFVRESVDITLYREMRLKATFVRLNGAGSSIISWTQSFRLIVDKDTWEEITYPGLNPIYVKRPLSAPRLVQSGMAVGAGVFIKAPEAINPGFLAEKPDIQYTELNLREMQTTWSYVMFVAENVAPFKRMGRPSPAMFASERH